MTAAQVAGQGSPGPTIESVRRAVFLTPKP